MEIGVRAGQGTCLARALFLVPFVVLHWGSDGIGRGGATSTLTDLAIPIDIDLEEGFLLRDGGRTRAVLADEETVLVQDPGVDVESSAIEDPQSAEGVSGGRHHAGIAPRERDIAFPVAVIPGDQDRGLASILDIGKAGVRIHEEIDVRGVRHQLEGGTRDRALTTLVMSLVIIRRGRRRSISFIRLGWADRGGRCLQIESDGISE